MTGVFVNVLTVLIGSTVDLLFRKMIPKKWTDFIMTGDHTMIFTKSTLDLVSSLIFAASLGVGVLLAAGFVLVFQGSIVLIAQAAAPYLTDYVIDEMTCVGSILILALGLNIIGVTNLKVMNYLPAIFIPIILCMFM